MLGGHNSAHNTSLEEEQLLQRGGLEDSVGGWAQERGGRWWAQAGWGEGIASISIWLQWTFVRRVDGEDDGKWIVPAHAGHWMPGMLNDDDVLFNAVCQALCYLFNVDRHYLFYVNLLNPPKSPIKYCRNKIIYVVPLFETRKCEIRNVDFCFIKTRNSEAQKYFTCSGTEASHR